MKINQLKSGVVLSYATQTINILSGLIYTPVMLRLLGQSEYGLYQLVQSVVSYLGLLSFGFSSGYMRFYSKYKVKNDTEGIAKLNGMFMLIFLAIAAVCLICGGVMTVRTDLVFGDGLTAAELYKARILMALMVFNMAVSFVNSVFTSNITAHERFFFQRIIELLKALFNPFLTLPLLILGFGSVGMVVISTVLTIWVFIMNSAYCIKKLKIKFIFKNLDFGFLKELWVFTFFIFVSMIVDQINWSIDKFLLGRMLGTTAVAVYGVAGQINSLYLTLSSAISGVFVPRVNMLVMQKNDSRELTDLFTRVGRMQFIILALVISGFMLFGKEFIAIWAGEGYDEAYIIGILIMLPVTVPLMQNLGIEIRRAKNLHKLPAFVMLGVAILNFVISIPLIKIWGATGAALGTFLGLFVNTVFINIYYQRKCGLNIIYFWKNIFGLLVFAAISGGLGFALKQCFEIHGITQLILSIIIYTLIYCVIVGIFGTNAYEKQLIKSVIKRRRMQ